MAMHSKIKTLQTKVYIDKADNGCHFVCLEARIVSTSGYTKNVREYIGMGDNREDARLLLRQLHDDFAAALVAENEKKANGEEGYTHDK